ncbi:MAG: hypothetical protein GWP62_08560 [Gammaproteobacteria bacterium]|jgi:hypothetical protein|nr:hypothetical protein [Gammaproteobacteria bacterium]
MRRGFILLVMWVLAVNSAGAADLVSLEVDYKDGRYSMESVIWVDAGVDATYEVFSDWDLSTQFSTAIVEARDLDPDEQGRPGFYIRNKGCVLFFCKSLVREGYVETQDDYLLQAYADPEKSDFRFCEESWEFVEQDGGTRVRYMLNFEPDFWVPPGIGPYMIKRKLSSDGGDAIGRIEEIAQEYAASRVAIGE